MSDTVLVPHIDRSERKITFAVWQDVEDILEENKRLQNTPQKSDWGRHIGSIPNVILHKWLTEEWERGNLSLKPYSKEFDLIIEKKLKDPEWKALRTDDSSNPFNLGWRA